MEGRGGEDPLVWWLAEMINLSEDPPRNEIKYTSNIDYASDDVAAVEAHHRSTERPMDRYSTPRLYLRGMWRLMSFLPVPYSRDSWNAYVPRISCCSVSLAC